MEWFSALGKDLAEFGKIIRDDTVEAAAKARKGKLGSGGSVHPAATETPEDDERRAATRKALERAQEEVEKDLEDLGWGDDEDVVATGSEQDADAAFASVEPADDGTHGETSSGATSDNGTARQASTGVRAEDEAAAEPASDLTAADEPAADGAADGTATAEADQGEAGDRTQPVAADGPVQAGAGAGRAAGEASPVADGNAVAADS